MNIRTNFPRRAFTLLELTIALVILAMFAAVALPTLMSLTHPATTATTGGSTPHNTGLSIFLLFVPATLFALAATSAWLTWHFRHHAKKTQALTPTTTPADTEPGQEPSKITSSAPRFR